MIDKSQLYDAFRQRFGGSTERAHLFRAPGRVNLIGEHTDYNDGWVLPMALDRYCYVLAQARTDSRLRIRSLQLDDTVEAGLDDPPPADHHWSAYPRGVACSLRQAGQPICGADLLISSEVPLGSGLSSSAALEVSTAFALLGVHGRQMDRTAIALACQKAESEYVGMRCGNMDQLAACFGADDRALMIDCRTLAVTPVPLDESQVRVVVANTMVKHALASSEYNQRRAECEEAVRRIRQNLPQVRALRDVSWEEISAEAERWPDKVRRRARHVTTEDARVHRAVEALRAGDFSQVGRLMYESHASLDCDYQVTCSELNTMVALARELPGCYGARMTGGGFGGCTVNLLRADAAQAFALDLAYRYEEATEMKPDVYLCRASQGAGEITA